MLCCAVQELLEEEVVNLEGFKWEVTGENTACGLCYTSGTTSRPKVCVGGGQVARSRQSVHMLNLLRFCIIKPTVSTAPPALPPPHA